MAARLSRPLARAATDERGGGGAVTIGSPPPGLRSESRLTEKSARREGGVRGVPFLSLFSGPISPPGAMHGHKGLSAGGEK